MDSIRMVTWLAPGIPLPFFERIRRTLGEQLPVPVSLASRTKRSGPDIGSTNPFGDGLADLGFLCAPAAVPASIREQAGFEFLGLAPLFEDDRYADRPVCYCDIVIRKDTPGTELADLEGLVFGYNDTTSLSGWLGLGAALNARGTRHEHFFSRCIETGGHLSSLQQLRSGEIRVASIDSNVLRTHPEALDGLRIIDSVGPWPSQPVVVRRTLDTETKIRLRNILRTCGPWPEWGFLGFRNQEDQLLKHVPTGSPIIEERSPKSLRTDTPRPSPNDRTSLS